MGDRRAMPEDAALFDQHGSAEDISGQATDQSVLGAQPGLRDVIYDASGARGEAAVQYRHAGGK